MKLLLVVAALATLFLCPRLVLACSCLGSPSVCTEFTGAEAIFVGTVTRVENQTNKDENGRQYIAGQVANVQVDEAFKGVKSPELIFRSHGTSCDVQYAEGQRWLFYAYYSEEEKAWAIGVCGRSTRLELATDDLVYLRGLPGSAQKTRIAGQLRDRDRSPLAGVKVKLIGALQTHEAVTDRNGLYEVYGLPPGKYTVQPETPADLKLWFAKPSGVVDLTDRSRQRIELAEKGCTGVDFVFTESTSIKGRVFGSDGRPLRNVCVRLLLKDKPAETLFLLSCTEEDGRFKINDINLGEYYLVANDDGVISSDEPFPSTYYPGVFEKEKATVLTIASGNKLEDLDIQIPAQRPTRIIQGRLLFSDGRPVDEETVEFTSEEKSGQDPDRVRAKTDAEGRFRLVVLEGSKGTVHGYLYGFSRETAKCPQIDKLVKAYQDIETNRLKLELNRDHHDLELVFPFPFCPKAKEERE